MMIGFCPLYSGSTGNASFVATASTRLLIDAGLSASRILEGLTPLGQDLDKIDGVLITHEHIDHIRGVGVLARKYGLRIYANAPTWAAMEQSGKLGNIPLRSHVEFDTCQDFCIGDIHVIPCRIPHDAAEPVGYSLGAGGRRVVVMTDTGHVNRGMLDVMMGADILMLESNHDIDLLHHNPRYPAHTKRRILSREGHLSNVSAAKTVSYLAGEGVRHIILGHLSAENNTPDLAFCTASEALMQAGIRVGNNMALCIASPDEPGDLWAV